MAQKSILITGAGSGIGRETAKLFAGKGWRVGAADISLATVTALKAELGDLIIPLAVDAADAASVQAMTETFAKATGGTIDVLFNCAGVLFMGPHESLSPAQQELLVDVNIKGVLNGCNAVFPIMKAVKRGHIINMSSTSAEYGVPDHAVYSATKFFVRGFTEAMNIEWARHGINVSAILVAYVKTPMMTEANATPPSVDKLGIKIETAQVAAKVWKAAHSQRTLHRIGADAHMLNLAVRVLGRHARGVYKHLTGY
ncbi:MAG: SDR family oxidoreductase [Maricaulaceae bacterium]